MNAIRDTLAMAWKEIQVLLKDRGALAVLFLLPLLFGSLYGSINLQAAGGSDDPIILLHVGLVNEDTGIFGSEIAKALRTIDELSLESIADVS